MFTTACCLVVELELGLDLLSGWSVVMHTYLCYFRLSLSHCRRNVPTITAWERNSVKTCFGCRCQLLVGNLMKRQNTGVDFLLFLCSASPHLLNQLPTSLTIPHPNYSSPSQRPSFEHAGLTCYTLLSPSIIFSLFHSKLKTYLFRK